MKVLYCLNLFPALTETFILNEIIKAQELGIQIEVFAFRKRNEKAVHDRVKDVKSIYYSKADRKFQKIATHLYFFMANPFAYVKTVFFAANPKNGIRKLFLNHLGDAKLIKTIAPDLIHAHFGILSSDFALLCNLLLGIDFTFTTHRNDIFNKPPANFEFKTRLAKKHITISEYNKRYLIENYGLPESKMTVIRCGIDFDRPELFIKRKKNIVPQILSVGSLIPRKNHTALIKVCAMLRRNGLNFVCKIIGDGSEKVHLEAEIVKKQLEKNVMLLGAKTHDEVFKELLRSDVFVLTSVSEGIPVCLMEAMAMGVPVVSSNINGIPELLDHGINGYLVNPTDIMGFSERIAMCLDRTLVSGYEKTYSKFNLKKEVQKLLAIWEK